MRTARLLTLALLSLAPSLACEDDKGVPAATMDAPVDVTSSPDAGDVGVPDVADAGIQDVADAKVGVDCAPVGCQDQARFNVPGYLARFGDDGRTVDVSACLGSTCGNVRVERLGQNPYASGHMGLQLGVDLSGEGWLTVFVRGGAPPDAQLEVRLRVATPTGRQLLDYTGSATGQDHCTGGAACGRCQAIIVDIDPADAGLPITSPDPNKGGHCGVDTTPRDAGADLLADAYACPPCASDEVCVQSNDSSSQCRSPIPTLTCRKLSAACRAELPLIPRTSRTCLGVSASCQAELCGQPYQCINTAPCGNETEAAQVWCYGP